MLNFDEDRTHTHKAGEKELKKVVMYYKDGSMQEITDVEPTMVLIGWEHFNKLKQEHEMFAKELRRIYGMIEQ